MTNGSLIQNDSKIFLSICDRRSSILFPPSPGRFLQMSLPWELKNHILSSLDLLDNSLLCIVTQCQTANFSIRTFDNDRHFFQTGSLRLGIQDEDDDTFNSEPCDVYNIIFPAQTCKPNGVDELVEGRSASRKRLSQGDTLAAVNEGENFGDEDISPVGEY